MQQDNKITLHTSPGQFADKAADVSEQIGEVVEALKELEAVILRTSHYWLGEAGDYYRVLYGENREEIREMIARLSARSQTLLQTAGLTEKSHEEGEMSQPLPADVL